MALLSAKLNPLPLLAGVLVIAGAVGLLRDRISAGAAAAKCAADGEPACGAERADAGVQLREGPAPAPVLEAGTACRDAGYLCADLANADRIQVRRWKNFAGTLVVHVPRPDFEDRNEAARLQEAAVRGLRAWNGQPFAILADLRGDREAHFEVRWSRTLSGTQVGVARTQWTTLTGLSVVAIELSTRNPFSPDRINDALQVQLTAAHEMGHALGLPHSDAERDVMYPTNTATSISARDYRSMEALYEFADGTEIVR